MKNAAIIILVLFSLMSFDAIDIKNTNRSTIDDIPQLNISRGLYPGVSTIFKFGRSQAVTATPSVIWDGAGVYYFLHDAQYMNVVSSDANDSLGGSGAWNLIMYGLDSLGYEQSEFITLDGLTPVTTTKKFYRLYRALIYQSGTESTTADANTGTISVDTQVGDTLQMQIKPTNGQTLMSIYTVPKGKTAYVTGVGASVGQGKQVYLKYKFRNCTCPNGAFSVKYTLDLYQQSVSQQLYTPLKVPELTDIVVSATTSSGTIDVSTSFGIILINN